MAMLISTPGTYLFSENISSDDPNLPYLIDLQVPGIILDLDKNVISGKNYPNQVAIKISAPGCVIRNGLITGFTRYFDYFCACQVFNRSELYLSNYASGMVGPTGPLCECNQDACLKYRTSVHESRSGSAALGTL